MEVCWSPPQARAIKKTEANATTRNMHLFTKSMLRVEKNGEYRGDLGVSLQVIETEPKTPLLALRTIGIASIRTPPCGCQSGVQYYKDPGRLGRWLKGTD
jgi:hypothetical protein